MSEIAEQKKYVIEYQAKDADGNPIGSLTHLEADTPEEMFEKQRLAHENAMRLVAKQNKYISDLKSRTPKPKPAEPTFQPKQLTAQQEVDATLALQNPKTAVQATRTLVEAAYPIADIEAEVKAAKVERANALGQQAAYAFMQRHLEDYLPNDANNGMMVKYLTDNGLDMLEQDNWEIAFDAVKSRLAERPKPKSELPIPDIEPEVPATSDNGSTADNGSRRAPASGIVPGSGQRPPAQRTGRATMTPPEMRQLYRTNRAEFNRRQRTNNWVK